MIRTARYPERIVCLTEETTETLYLLGEQDRIVGISGFTVRPPEVRKEKPKVSAFTSAKIDRIIDLKPDLVLGFSDLQADIAAALIREGVNVLVMNHRSVPEILDMILMLSAMVGAGDRGIALVKGYEERIEATRIAAAKFKRRPRVYFEEWDEPMISAIRWVSELVTIAGGDDCFIELGLMPLGKDRIIADSARVIDANPEIIIGSWCGKKFRPEKVAARAGWEVIDAVKNGKLFEIKSPNILQPGPAALTDGLDQLHQIMQSFDTE
jgi:iron complex transport system substrate-binding protein